MPPVQKKCPRRLPDGLAAREKYGKHIVFSLSPKYTSFLKDFSTVDNPCTGQLQSASRIRTWQNLIGPFIDNDTGEDAALRDAPASWGNHPEYRLLEDGPSNWFSVEAQSISSWLK